MDKSIMVGALLNACVSAVQQLYMKLRDIWSDDISDHGGRVRVDVFSGLAKMTLDVMGSAGILIFPQILDCYP